MRLVRVDELEVEKVELKDLLDTLEQILRQGCVSPIIADQDFRKIKKGEKTVAALKILGVKYVPASTYEEKRMVRLEDLGFYDEVSGNPLKVYEDMVELLVRNWPTPLVKSKFLSTSDKSAWVKLEAFNPFSNSIKDRVGWYMVKEAGHELLRLGKMYEATSTNTGIALASMAAIMGLKARLYVPQSIQRVTDIYLKVLGAEVHRVPTSLTVEAISKVEQEAVRDGAVHLNQFENDANFKVHLRYTAKELDLQLKHKKIRPKAIIAGMGTSGHLSAIAFYFKNRYPETEIIAVQPAPDNIIPGIRRIETGMKWIHWIKYDKTVDVTRDEAIKCAVDFARNEGILIGLSSGAVIAAYLKEAKNPGNYVLIFPDSGYKYFEQFSEYLNKQQSLH